MKRKKIIALIAAILLLVSVVRLTFAFARYAIVERRFSSVRVGDNRDSVTTRLGRANYYHGKCGVIHIPDKNCAEEFVYSHPFAPIIPEYHIVAFASDGRVIESDDWDSP